MSTTIEKAKIEDIKRLAERSDDEYSLMELFKGTRRACEIEVMVWQTLQACVINHKKHRVAFSWRGDGVFSCSGGGLADNATAYKTLLKGYFIEEQRDGKTIIIMTQKLIDRLDDFFAKQKSEQIT